MKKYRQYFACIALAALVLLAGFPATAAQAAAADITFRPEAGFWSDPTFLPARGLTGFEILKKIKVTVFLEDKTVKTAELTQSNPTATISYQTDGRMPVKYKMEYQLINRSFAHEDLARSKFVTYGYEDSPFKLKRLVLPAQGDGKAGNSSVNVTVKVKDAELFTNDVFSTAKGSISALDWLNEIRVEVKKGNKKIGEGKLSNGNLSVTCNSSVSVKDAVSIKLNFDWKNKWGIKSAEFAYSGPGQVIEIGTAEIEKTRRLTTPTKENN